MGLGHLSQTEDSLQRLGNNLGVASASQQLASMTTAVASLSTTIMTIQVQQQQQLQTQ
jgi:hypothetical protein